MSSQTRNIVIFGSGREKTSFQTREVNEKKETAVEERSTDSDRGIQKIVGNQMLIMPANVPHSVHAVKAFKMLLIMIKG